MREVRKRGKELALEGKEMESVNALVEVSLLVFKYVLQSSAN